MHRAVKSIAVLGALAALSLPASAFARGERDEEHHRHEHQRRTSVPEFDPSAAGAIAAVIAGGGLVFARRRKPKA